jgi:hypothetical protein
MICGTFDGSITIAVMRTEGFKIVFQPAVRAPTMDHSTFQWTPT